MAVARRWKMKWENEGGDLNKFTTKVQANMQMKGGRKQASVLCKRSFLPCQMNMEWFRSQRGSS